MSLSRAVRPASMDGWSNRHAPRGTGPGCGGETRTYLLRDDRERLGSRAHHRAARKVIIVNSGVVTDRPYLTEATPRPRDVAVKHMHARVPRRCSSRVLR